MTGKEILNQIDPGTGLTLDELIDAFSSSPIKAKNLKQWIIDYANQKQQEKTE